MTIQAEDCRQPTLIPAVASAFVNINSTLPSSSTGERVF